MFTGIIETLGTVRRLSRRRRGRKLLIAAPRLARSSRPGDSIAVNGVCLSVAARNTGALAFDVIPETLRRTTLGRLQPRDRVHIERAMRAGDRLHGHILLGHVDATARVVATKMRGRERWLDLHVPPRFLVYCVPKGSLAVDGVSLTVGEIRGRRVRIYLIPTTLRKTLLGRLGRGDRVNLEADVLVKTALQWLRRRPRRWR